MRVWAQPRLASFEPHLLGQAPGSAQALQGRAVVGPLAPQGLRLPPSLGEETPDSHCPFLQDGIMNSEIVHVGQLTGTEKR